MVTVAGVVIGFLVGGIPFGFLVGRVVLKDDIRNHGSGNIGATNVARVIGWKWGSFVLLLDALKGFLPTFAVLRYCQGPDFSWHSTVAAGAATILGHMYPVYLKLRGGKGVATGLGVVLAVMPQATLIAFVAFLLLAAATRLIALASMTAAVVFGVTAMIQLGDSAFDATHWPLTVFSIAVPLLIIWRHRSNIARLVTGTEPRVTDKPSQPETPDESSGDAE